MRNVLVLLLCFALALSKAQNGVPVSTLPAVDSLGQNDFFPVVQGGHYHKAYIRQLPAGCACPPAGKGGYVQYNGSGTNTSDSLFTRNALTGATTIAYYENAIVKAGEQVKGVIGVLDGAANQMYQEGTGNYALSGVVDATPVGGKPMTAVMGIVNLSNHLVDVVSVDTGGPQMQYDSMHFGIGRNGVYFSAIGGQYTFPAYQGANGQVLTSDGGGNLSWQTPAGGGSAVQTVHVFLSIAQISNMVTSPLQLIAAPGSGKFIQVLGITGRLNFNTTAYVDTPTVNPGYSYNSGLGVYFDNSNLGVYYNTTLLFASQTAYGNFNLSNAPFGVDNAPLMLSVYDGGLIPTNPYAGNGTLDIYVTYTIVNE